MSKGDTFPVVCGVSVWLDEDQQQVVAQGGGEPLSCDAQCFAMGRGHTHLLSCSGGRDSHCARARFTPVLQDTVRHSARTLQGEPHDELQHAAYCEVLGWEDWCAAGSPEERRGFSLCPHICQHRDHLHDAPRWHGASLIHTTAHQHCVLPLWHPRFDPTSASSMEYPRDGHTTKSGHLYTCSHRRRHPPKHVTFVIDRSAAMADNVQQPHLQFLRHLRLANCLGAALEVGCRKGGLGRTCRLRDKKESEV